MKAEQIEEGASMCACVRLGGAEGMRYEAAGRADVKVRR